jgi:hypothetical protein
VASWGNERSHNANTVSVSWNPFFLTSHVVILDIGDIIYMSHSLVLAAL